MATNSALAVIAVATGVIAPRLLGPSGEGELAAIQTWPLLLGTLSMLGLDSALVYFISREPERGKQLTATAMLIGLLSSLLVGAIAWFAMPFLLSAQQPDVISAARVFLLVGVLYAVVGIPIGSLRGANSFAIWNLFRIAPALAWLGILCASWFFKSARPIPLSRWYLGAILCCGLPILIVVKRRLQGRPRPDRRLAGKLLRFRPSLRGDVSSPDRQPAIRPAADHRVPASPVAGVLRCRGGLERRGCPADVGHRICPVPASVRRTGQPSARPVARPLRSRAERPSRR